MASEIITDPDLAVSKWREALDEIRRLQHEIVDRETKIEELARLNYEALFEARRYQSLHAKAAEDCDYWQRKAAMQEGQLKAIGLVADEASQSLQRVSLATIELASQEPPPAAPQVQPAAPRKPPVADPATKPKPAIEDEPFDRPLFLRSIPDRPAPTVHRTPLPPMAEFSGIA